MTSSSRKALLSILALCTLCAGLVATLHTHGARPRLPAELEPGNGIVVRAGHGLPASLQPGDRIAAIESIPVENHHQLDFLLDALRVSGPVRLEIIRGEQKATVTAPLLPTMNEGLLAANIFSGCLFWLFGVLVILLCRLEREVLLFYAMAMSLSLLIFVYWPENDFGIPGANWLGAMLTFGLYPLTVTMLLHFSVGFPAYGVGWIKKLALLLYLPSLSLSAVLFLTWLQARHGNGAADVAVHLAAVQGLRFYLAAIFLASPLLWLFRLKETTEPATRQKLKWMLFGFVTGIAPHLFLFELPQGFGREPLLAEQITLLFSPMAAASIMVAMVRYRLFDIDLIINRSLVYMLLLMFVAGAYLGLVAAADFLLAGQLGSAAGVRIGMVLLLAALFEPARRISQTAVDRFFFRRRYDQRQALIELSRSISHQPDINLLAGTLARIVGEVLGVARVAVYFVDEDGRRLLPVPLPGQETSGPLEAAKFFGSPAASENGLLPHLEELGLEGCQLGVRLVAEGRPVGLLALGPRNPPQPFAAEDHGFLEAAAAQVSLAFQAARAFHQLREMNLKLEQKVFERTAQMAGANDRLVEQYVQLQQLDEMKESLTRMIVHDLRNPLATISLGIELLQCEGGGLSAEIKETLKNIEGATRHMQEMIQSMLDTAKMEAGALRLEPRDESAGELIRESLERVRLQAENKGIALQGGSGADIRVRVDGPLFSRVLVNLLANAIRYAPTREAIRLEASRPAENRVAFSVTNRGPAIPPEVQQKLFEKFFQAEGGRSGGGAGLGLHFCRMVTEAHGGRIYVVSPLPGEGIGASFVVELPAPPPEKP